MNQIDMDYEYFARLLWSLNSDQVKEMAKKFQVAESTVIRWQRGTSNPHPLVASQIGHFAAKLIARRWGKRK